MYAIRSYYALGDRVQARIFNAVLPQPLQQIVNQQPFRRTARLVGIMAVPVGFYFAEEPEARELPQSILSQMSRQVKAGGNLR